MELMTLLFLQLGFMVVGALAAIVFGVKGKLEIISLSYLLGSSIISLLFFLFHWWFKLGLDSLNFILTFIISLTGLFLWLLFTKKTSVMAQFFNWDIRKRWQKLLKIERIVLLVILTLIGYSFFENYFWPITDWDALAFYDFRARIIALRGSMIEGIQLGYFFQYPPYTSLLHVFGYLFGVQRVKVAYSFIYTSMLLLFYTLLRKKQDRTISGIATLILASSTMIFEHAVTAYSNLPYTAFFALGMIYLWFYMRRGLRQDLILGGLLIGFSTWVRSTEPFWLVALFPLAWGYYKHRSHLLLITLLAFWLSLPDRLWRQFLSYLDSLSPLSLFEAQTHTITAIKEFITQGDGLGVLLIHAWQVSTYLIQILIPEFFLLFLLFLFTVSYNAKRGLPELISLILLFAIVWGGTFIFSFTWETWNVIAGSIIRMCMIFIPLLIFATATDLQYQKETK